MPPRVGDAGLREILPRAADREHLRDGVDAGRQQLGHGPDQTLERVRQPAPLLHRRGGEPEPRAVTARSTGTASGASRRPRDGRACLPRGRPSSARRRSALAPGWRRGPSPTGSPCRTPGRWRRVLGHHRGDLLLQAEGAVVAAQDELQRLADLVQDVLARARGGDELPGSPRTQTAEHRCVLDTRSRRRPPPPCCAAGDGGGVGGRRSG